MAQISIIKNTCSTATSDTVAGCVTKTSPLSIFSFSQQMAELNSCVNQDAAIAWQKNVSEDFINCCGNNKMDINFFMDMFSSTPKEIDTTNYTQRYRAHENQNITTDSAGLAAAGITQRFTLGRSSHSGAGTSSSLFVGMTLYNYRSGQNVRVTAINTTAPYAHIITVTNTSTENVSIVKGDKFIRIPAVLVGGTACRAGQTSLNTHFTTKGLNKLRLSQGWCMDLEMDKPYADKLRFASFVDRNFNESERVLPVLKTNAMAEITQAANLMLFIGNKITNTAISVGEWTGGDGMIGAIKGAGKSWDYSATDGFSLLNDFEEIILSEDKIKRTNEWLLMGSLQFLASMTRKSKNDSYSEITALDFGTIGQFGADKETIKKYATKNFEYLNKKVMFKEFGELNNSNSLGNGIFPDLGIMLAMDGLTNSKGESIPAIQFFKSKDVKGQWADMEEVDRDMRFIDSCEKIEGDIRKSLFWMFHCPERHYLLNPTYCA